MSAYEEEAGRLLSRLMFGFLLDGIHGNERPVFTLTSEEYRRRMEALAESRSEDYERRAR